MLLQVASVTILSQRVPACAVRDSSGHLIYKHDLLPLICRLSKLPVDGYPSMSLSLAMMGCLAAILYTVWSLLLRRILLTSPLDNLPSPPSPSFLKGLYCNNNIITRTHVWLAGNLSQVAARQSWKYRRRHAEVYGPVSVLHGPIGVRDSLSPIAHLS